MIRLILAMRRCLGFENFGISEIMEDAEFKEPHGWLYGVYDSQISNQLDMGDTVGAKKTEKRLAEIKKLVTSRWFDASAMGAASKAAKQTRRGAKLNREDARDILQDFAIWMMTGKVDLEGDGRVKKTTPGHERVMEKLAKSHQDSLYEISAKDIRAMFSTIAHNRTAKIAQRKLTRQITEREHMIIDNGEGGELTTEDLVTRKEETIENILKSLKRMNSAITRMIKKEDKRATHDSGLLPAMFEIWWKHLTKPSATSNTILQKIKADREIANIKQNYGANKGKPFSNDTLEEKFAYMRFVIQEFLKDNIEDIVIDDVKDSLNLEGKKIVKRASADILRWARILLGKEYITPKKMAIQLYNKKSKKASDEMIAQELIQIANLIL